MTLKGLVECYNWPVVGIYPMGQYWLNKDNCFPSVLAAILCQPKPRQSAMSNLRNVTWNTAMEGNIVKSCGCIFHIIIICFILKYIMALRKQYRR